MSVKIRDPSLALQAALKSRIDAALPTTSVLDDVPHNQDYPYIVIGDEDQSPWFTKDHGGVEIIATVRAWSRGKGSQEVKSLLGTVREKVTQLGLDLSASSFKVTVVSFDSLQIVREADGLTRQGILRLHFKIEDLT